MAIKKFLKDFSATNVIVYLIIRREVDEYYWNSVTKNYVSTVVSDCYITTAENSVIKGRYEYTEATLFNDGLYSGIFYLQIGGVPNPDNDRIIGSGYMNVRDDAEVFLDQNVSNVLSDPIEGPYSASHLLKVIAASTAGKVAGMDTLTPVFQAIDNSKARIAATVDNDGNRLSVVIDAS